MAAEKSATGRQAALDFLPALGGLVGTIGQRDEFIVRLDNFMAAVADQLGCERCAIFQLARAASSSRAIQFELLSGEPLPESWHQERLFSAALQKETAVTERRPVGRVERLDGGEALRSIVCVPLISEGRKIGVLVSANKLGGGDFARGDVELLLELAVLLAPTTAMIQLVDEIERLSFTDELTRLYNYRYLRQYLALEIRRALRYKKQLSLLFIDIDGFKGVNDTHGHLIGSEVLAEVGSVLKASVRESDVVSRYGGDEFVIVLPETSLRDATGIAERVRQQVKAHNFCGSRLTMELTVSIGVANFPEHSSTVDGLLKKADTAMYRAKRMSKNAIEVAI